MQGAKPFQNFTQKPNNRTQQTTSMMVQEMQQITKNGLLFIQQVQNPYGQQHQESPNMTQSIQNQNTSIRNSFKGNGTGASAQMPQSANQTMQTNSGQKNPGTV